MYLVAFSAVCVSILAILLIDVFVKKGSLIFVKMSEDLEIDAEIRPSARRAALNYGNDVEYTDFRFNMTRIDELQEERYNNSLKTGEKFVKHRLSPRIVLEAIDEQRGRSFGYYSNDAEQRDWEKTFQHFEGVSLPSREDAYGDIGKFNVLRTLYFIKTEREREI